MRAINEKLSGCCLDSLVSISDAFCQACIEQLHDRVEVLLDRQNEIMDTIANEAIVSSDAAARAAAMKWRNLRNSDGKK